MQKKRFFILIVFLALITVGCSGTGTTVTAPDQASEVVFKTPEEAITSYLEGVAQSDIHKISQTFAINEMSEKFKFDLVFEGWGDRYMLEEWLSPTDHPFYVEINKMQLSGQLFNEVKIFAYSLLSSEMVYDLSAISNKMDAERINSFMKDVDPKRLSSLEVKKIGLPDKFMNSDTYLYHAARIALIYGADESTQQVALFSFEQNYYYLGFTLLRYGENWKISNLTSTRANIMFGTGVLQKTTVEEFESMINGN